MTAAAVSWVYRMVGIVPCVVIPAVVSVIPSVAEPSPVVPPVWTVVIWVVIWIKPWVVVPRRMPAVVTVHSVWIPWTCPVVEVVNIHIRYIIIALLLHTTCKVNIIHAIPVQRVCYACYGIAMERVTWHFCVTGAKFHKVPTTVIIFVCTRALRCRHPCWRCRWLGLQFLLSEVHVILR